MTSAIVGQGRDHIVMIEQDNMVGIGTQELRMARFSSEITP